MREPSDKPHRANAAGFVLAGGRSSRMGSDKALALFGGIPLIRVALETLAEAQFSSRIAGSRSSLHAFAEEIADTFPETGPLGGVHAALAGSTAEWNLFLPVDMPLMPASLLVSLLERAQLTDAPVTVARLNGLIQPFPVVLRAGALAAIAQRLSAGETACHRAWQSIPLEMGSTLNAVAVELLLQSGQCTPGLGRTGLGRTGLGRTGLPPALWFQSANTPEELLRLNRIAARLQPLKNPRPESHSQVI